MAVNGCVALTATDADAGVTSMEVSVAVPDVPDPEPEPEPEPEFVPVLGNPLQDTRNTRQTAASVDPKAFTALPPGEDLIPKIFLIWFGTDVCSDPGLAHLRLSFWCSYWEGSISSF